MLEINKYIIKNCPAIFLACGCKNREVKVWNCQDCTDCVMKQIVGILKNPNNCKYSGKPLVFTDELLQLLQIEEVENDR